MRRERWFLVGLILLLLVACSDTGGIPDGGGGDEKITVEPLRKPSESQTGRFEFTNTSSEAVSFEIVTIENTRDSEPIAQWFDIAPQRGTIPARESIIVTLTTDEDFSQPGFYSSRLIVKYPGGETRFSATAQLGETDAEVTLSKTSLRLAAGETGSLIIRASGFSGPVAISFARGDDGLPDGQITVRIEGAGDPPVISNGATAELFVTPVENAVAGTYEIIVAGESGSQTASRVFSVTVPGSGGSGEKGSISGSVRTDNFLGNFIVPSSLGGQSLTVQGSRPDYVPGQLLVQFQNAGLATTANRAEIYQSLSQALRADYEFRVLEAGSFNEPALIAIPAGQSVEEAAARLSADPRIAYAEPNYYIYPMSIPDDDRVNELWNMAVSGVPVAWEARSESSKVVAVLDSGIALNHPDLNGIFVSDGYDFCGSVRPAGDGSVCNYDSNVQPDYSSDTHGTHITGIIAAQGNNGRGVAGVLHSSARILPVKIFYDRTFTTVNALSDAIRWAAGIDNIGGAPNNDHPADIINLSLGTDDYSATLEGAVKDAQNAGALLMAAAGNSGASEVLYPARFNGVIAVGSVNSNFERSCFSNYGAELDLMAAGGDSSICGRPDESVLSTFPNGNYGTEAGTSQAVPVVSGIAALVWAEHSDWSADQVARHLKATAYDLGSANQYGAGLVRADVALGLLGPTNDNRNVEASVTVDSADDSGIATVTLDLLRGTSDSFSIGGLEAGSYSVEAEASRDSRTLRGSKSIRLDAGESESVTLNLQP